MKLYAQHGYGEGEKISQGLQKGLISGVVYGAKDINPDRLRERLGGIATSMPTAGRVLDPQYYVSLIGSDPNIRLGKLEEYPYFTVRRRSQLESNDLIKEEIRKVIEFQAGLPVSAIIAPNILISRSFDSVEAVIAKNFIRQAKGIYEEYSDKRPLYVTLAISREALIDFTELEAFLNDVTLLDKQPDGFYLLVGARSVEARTDLYNADVIAAWMLLNHSLKINGYEIINGYSDLISPFLGAVGGDIGCTGWWSNLRTFSMDRFAPESTGGRQPVQRYLCTKLLNRITFYELDALRRIFPEVVNGLSVDTEYLGEPERSIEVLQSWEALNSLLSTLTASSDPSRNVGKCTDAINYANDLYISIRARYRLDPKSDDSHLEALQEGMSLFKKRAEL
ncbi:MAG: hypothetical protein OEW15_02445 [Nitrospirota bacterium]|nr:hypothetical protein [Nitrospirota bacterium]